MVRHHVDHIRDYIPAQQVETPSHELNPVEDVPRPSIQHIPDNGVPSENVTPIPVETLSGPR